MALAMITSLQSAFDKFENRFVPSGKTSFNKVFNNTQRICGIIKSGFLRRGVLVISQSARVGEPVLINTPLLVGCLARAVIWNRFNGLLDRPGKLLKQLDQSTLPLTPH
jgi:hypothetical protein